ncbi:MAG: 23S rRNA methyltransferase [Betaproteobacteria bacterium SG8_39]|nr:MAG: 23S rRNA methyltransferase [Betaproteobacteria bacterium SG8_39]
MKRRTPISVSIDSLSAEGRGVGRNAEGKVVFVDGALAGERVEAVVLRSKPSFDLMQAQTVHHAASGRRTPRCRYFGLCGGCATQHADAQTQMAAKQRGLEEAFARIGKVRPRTLLPILYGPEWGYRHRARMTARWVAKKGGALVGFHERRSHYAVDMESCEVLPGAVSALIRPLRDLIDGLSIRERLPQIEVAVGDRVTALVFRNLEPLSSQDEDALRAFAEQHGIWAWLQPGGPATAQPFHPVSGPVLDYALPEFGLRIGFRPTDFTQVNHPVNRALVHRALSLLAPAPGERIADLFCGLGNFSLPIARSGATVVGLESSAPLIACARENAAANGLGEHQVSFREANLYEDVAASLAAVAPFDKVLIDPPRAGAMDVVKALSEPLPRRIVYVSCDPATLARDAGFLVTVQGYRLEAAGVVNMFPHTAHVESIALFER